MCGWRPGCCKTNVIAEDNEVESLVVRSMAVEDIRPLVEPQLPEEVKWSDVETFLLEESDAPDIDTVTDDPTEYAHHLCARMLDKQLALQDATQP